jgi:hypothetical protein
MDKIFSGLVWSCVLVYVDDLVIYSRSLEEHMEQVRTVLQILKENRVILRASKAHFFVTKGVYLGRSIDLKKHTIEVLQDSIRPLQIVRVPNNKKEVQQFLGLAHRFSEHLPMLAETASPLYEVLKKNGEWKTEKIEEAVAKIKSQLLSPAVLKIPNMEKPFIVFVDASEVAICMILAQGRVKWGEVDERGSLKESALRDLHLVGFYNKSLKQSQRKWTIPQKELYALHYFATKKLYSMLGGGGPHMIMVDAPGSAGLLTARMRNREMVRWASDLAQFNFKPCKVASKLQWADAGTRPPFIEENLIGSDKLANPLLEVKEWKKAIVEEEKGRTREHEQVSEEKVRSVEVMKVEVSKEERGIIEDEEWLKELMKLRNEGEWEKMKKFSEKERAASENLVEREDGSLWKREQGLMGKEIWLKFIANGKKRQELLKRAHEGEGAHAGRSKDKMRLWLKRRAGVWWPNMKRDTMEWDRECELCSKFRTRPFGVGELKATFEVERLFQRVCLDVVPFEEAYVLVVVDDLSRYVWLVRMEDGSAEELVRAFMSKVWPIIAWACVEIIWSDAGSVLASAEWEDVAELMESRVGGALPRMLRQNGVCEATVKTMKKVLGMSLRENMLERSKMWLLLPVVEKVMRETPLESRGGLMPNEIVFGRIREQLVEEDCRMEWSDLVEEVRKVEESVSKALKRDREKGFKAANKSRKKILFKKGDICMKRREKKVAEFNLEEKWNGLYEVMDVLSGNRLRLRNLLVEGADPVVVHVEKCKKVTESARVQERERERKSRKGDGIFEVKSLKDRKLVEGKIFYLVEWEGFAEYTWEPIENLEGAKELIEIFEKRVGNDGENGEDERRKEEEDNLEDSKLVGGDKVYIPEENEEEQLNNALLMNNDVNYVQVEELIGQVESKWEDMKVKELRRECQKRGIPKSGSKKKLLERLKNMNQDGQGSNGNIDVVESWWNELATNAGYAFGYWEINRIPAATLEGNTFIPGDRVRVVWFWVPLSEVLRRKGKIELRNIIGSELFCQFDPVRQIFFKPQFSSGLRLQPWT